MGKIYKKNQWKNPRPSEGTNTPRRGRDAQKPKEASMKSSTVLSLCIIPSDIAGHF